MPTPRTPNNILADALRRHQLQVHRFATSLNGTVQQRIVGVRADLVRILAQGDPTEPTRQGDKINRINAVTAEANRAVSTVYRGINSHTASELTDLAATDQAVVAKIITKNSSAKGISTIPARKVDAIVERALVNGAPSSKWWQRQSADVVKRYHDEINQGMRAGESVGDLIQRVRGTAAQQYQDGILRVPLANAEALVRSSVLSVANDMRATEFAANADILAGRAVLVTFDDRTCPQCMGFAGALYDHSGDPLPESPVQQWLPSDGLPLHFSCRCIWTPYLRDEAPPDDLSFENWLVDQPAGDQRDILGPQWYAAWKSGELKDLRDRIDGKGRPITLKELRGETQKAA